MKTNTLKIEKRKTSTSAIALLVLTILSVSPAIASADSLLGNGAKHENNSNSNTFLTGSIHATGHLFNDDRNENDHNEDDHSSNGNGDNNDHQNNGNHGQGNNSDHNGNSSSTNNTDKRGPRLYWVSSYKTTASTTHLVWITTERSDSRAWVRGSDDIDTSTATSMSLGGMIYVHDLEIRNLAPNTKYFYIVGSADAAGNVTTSQSKSFTTSTQ